MKIAYILASFPKASETFIQREINALQNDGTQITVFALQNPGDQDPRHESLPTETHYADGLSLKTKLSACLYALLRHPLRLTRALLLVLARLLCHPLACRFLGRYFAAAIAFARRAEEMGIQHVHAHFLFVPADIALLMSILMGCNHTVSAHAWDIHTQPASALRRRARRAAGIAVCTLEGQRIVRQAIPAALANNVTLVHHGVPLDTLPAPDPESGLLVAAGRLVEKKGYSDLVRACEQLHKRNTVFSCLIAGDGPLRSELATLIDKLELRDHVQLMGQLDQGEMQLLHARATVFVHPAVCTTAGDRDGIPNVLLEAMAMGVPVVATNVGGIPEVVNDGVNGYLVPSHAPGELAARVIDLLSDPARRRQMGANGRAMVQARFSLSATAANMTSFFREQSL